jgi:hypothetical protein
MAEQVIQKSSKSTPTSLVRRITPQDKALAELIVEVRQVQGWNLQTPGDAKLMASTWKKHLDRSGVRYELYTKLVDMAIDHRKKQILAGLQPTPLTVELLLACFDSYKAQMLDKHRKLKQVLQEIYVVIERVRAGYIPEEVGVVSLLGVGTDEDEGASFKELAERVSARYQQKVDEFLEEHHLVSEGGSTS